MVQNRERWKALPKDTRDVAFLLFNLEAYVIQAAFAQSCSEVGLPYSSSPIIVT